MAESPELIVVIPVYNERDAIEAVLRDWDTTLSGLDIDYLIQVYNDGSKDDTATRLDLLAPEMPHLRIHHKQNSGHGPTILSGYRNAVTAPWIFQVDSDNEMRPEGFVGLWQLREQYDFLIGQRNGRNSPWPRRVISAISRASVSLCYGTGVHDVNAPYRLMRSSAFSPLFAGIPDDTFAPNLIVSGFACHRRLRIFETPVTHYQRETGEVSIKKWRLFKAAVKSFIQTIRFRFSGLGKVG